MRKQAWDSRPWGLCHCFEADQRLCLLLVLQECPDENLNHAITLTTNQEVITLTKPAAGMTPNEFISLLDQVIGHLHSNEEWIERDRKTGTETDTRQLWAMCQCACVILFIHAFILEICLHYNTCTTRQMFLQFDRNGNGYLDATEFEEAIDSSGIVLNSKEKVILMMMADEDSNRQISYG